MAAVIRPTRRDERRAETIREIKALAMAQIAAGGPDAVSLSGIVREMSMSPAAVYRYFANRDALLADLVVDSYDDLADHLENLPRGRGSAADHLGAVLRGVRAWATLHENAYRLIFQTTIGSGEHFAVDRTVSASSRSMAVIVEAVARVADGDGPASETRSGPGGALAVAFDAWRKRSGLTDVPVEVLELAFLSWTRLHGIISLELGGHLAATGIGADVLFDAEVETIRSQAALLPRMPILT